ncbi:MAG: radical SAM protein [Dehalococcoidales bacterium]
MIVREITARSVLSRSKVYKYTINPYTGCQHACTYCYARFMKRFTAHKEPWGQFVDVKINAPDLLLREVKRKPAGRVWISGVCDPYQPIERKYKLTRKCLEILIQHDWPITIQTRSALVLRDLELLRRSPDVEVGITVTTADDKIRRLFEPHASPIKERIGVLGELRLAGIRTFVMIAPMLPGAEALVNILDGKVDYVLIDRMNYHYADWVYRKYQLESPSLSLKSQELCSGFEKRGISCRVLF